MKEDLIILVESLPNSYLFTQLTGDFPVADELFQGLRSMFVKKTIPNWVAYWVQIYLDIHHVLRQDVGRGFSELLGASGSMPSSVKAHYQCCPLRIF
jgi:hypothetical protein